MRFRIALSKDGFASETHTFDQRKRTGGWVPGDGCELIFRPPRPLADGSYEWRAWAWNGVEWVGGGPPRKLRVDTVAAAEIAELRMTWDADLRTVWLRWDPVTVDLNGDAEYVVGYHVYRYARGPDLPRVRPFEIGFVETPEFVDVDPDPASEILYYKIAAEDAAGNVTGVRD